MKPSNEMPSAAEFGLLRAHLAIAGFSQAQITEAIGDKVNDRTRAEIAAQLKEYLKNLPAQIVPRVKLLGYKIPLSSVWTYKNIIEPVVKLVRDDK